MNDESPQLVQTLRADPAARLAAAAFAVALLPYLIPVLSERALETFGRVYAQLAPTAAALAALRWGLPEIEDSDERRFWNIWTAALGAWLALSLLDLALAGSPQPQRLGVDLARDVLVLGFYLSIIIAAEWRPHLAAHPARELTRALEPIGAVVFAFGVLTYAVGVPGASTREEYSAWALLLYVVLDGYVVFRLAKSRARCESPRWRVLYGWLTGAAGLWMLADTLELLMWAGILTWVPYGTPLDALWILPFAPLVVAARLREHPFPAIEPSTPPPHPMPPGRGWVGPLPAYAVVLPLLHFAGYSFGWLDPASRDGREVCELVLLILLGGLAVWRQRSLESENRRLDAERSSAAAQVQQHVYHDTLTQLPSRVAFIERLGRSLDRAKHRRDYLFAVLHVDLDRFKLINDSLGPERADRVLIDLASRLNACVRPGDMVARLGPDEFGILADHFRPSNPGADAGRVAERIEEQALSRPFRFGNEELWVTARDVAARIRDQALTRPFDIDTHEVYASASIGIALSATGYDAPDALLRDAEAAMHRAKRRGGGHYELFDSAMQSEALARLTLETDLHRAVENRQFHIHYQPIVSLSSGEIVGFEALARWNHPRRGLLLPEEFISAAEETGLIIPISAWMIGEACARVASWQDRFARDPALFVSLNFSSKQFASAESMARVVAALHDAKLDGRQLKLELTESVMIQDFKTVIAAVEPLRTIGVQVHIDDFGTGYSSLSYLHRLPTDAIKIDRSFIERMDTDPAAEAMVGSIVELAHNLGRQVVAEGVQTAGQLQRLRAMGCEYGQGFYFARPGDEATAEALLESGRSWRADTADPGPESREP